MAEIKHKLFHEILNDDNRIQGSTLNEIFDAVDLTIDFTGATKIIERVLHVYEVASNIHELPYELKTEYKNICDQLKFTINTKSFQQRISSIKTAKNEILRRMGGYPLSAMLVEPLSQVCENNPEKKYLLDLLTFMLIEIKRKNPNVNDKIIENAATLVRKYISGGTRLKQGIKNPPLNFSQVGVLAQRVKEFPLVPLEQQLITAWSKTYELLATQKSADIDNITPYELPNKAQIRPYVLFTYDDAIDAEDAFTEIVEVTSVNEETSFQTKNASFIYGSQLSIFEKMHLPQRTNSLSNSETTLLVAFLKEQLANANEMPVSFLAALALLTSRKLAYCLTLRVYEQKDFTTADDDYIDLHRGAWVRKSIQMPSCYTPNEADKPFLNDYQPFVSLALPSEVLNALKALCVDKKHLGLSLSSILNISGDGNTEITALLNHFAENSQVFRKISPAACRTVLFELFNQKFDGAYASLALANTEYDTTTSLYYLFACINELANDYTDIVKNLGFEYSEARENTPQNRAFSGSQMTIDTEKLIALFKKRRQELLTLIETENLSLEDIITRFNLFSCYTTMLFIGATAHRPRTEFSFTKFTIDEDAGYILLSDKVHHHESACRVVPLCESMKIQLQSYREFAKVTAKSLKKQEPELAESIARIYGEYDHNQPMLCLIDENRRIQPIGKSNIEAYLAPESNLPLNLFRHLWASKIRENGEFKRVKAMMGHIGSGEHVLSNYSCASISDTKFMATSIETLLKDISLLPIDIKPVRGPCVQVKVNQEIKSYIPSYLQSTPSKTRKEKLQWVRTLIKPVLKQLKNNETFKATKDKLVIQALSASTTNIKMQERIYLLNRYLDKIHKNKTWVGLQNSCRDLDMSNDIVHVMQQHNNLSQAISNWINRGLTVTQTADNHLVKIWLSLIIHSKMNVPLTKENVLTITQKPFLEKAICFFELQDFHDKKSRIIVDSYTLLLLKKFRGYSNASISIPPLKRLFKSAIDQILSNIMTRREPAFVKLKSIDDVTKFMCRSRNDTHCSLAHAYQNNKIQTTCLQPEKLVRWLSDKPRHISTTAELTESDGLLCDYKADFNKKSNYKKSLDLIKKISADLNTYGLSNDPKAKIKKLIISTWANFIKSSKEKNLDILIQNSTDIEDVVIATIVWLIDVSNRSGRQKRKLTALSTVQSYLSIVAKPLLEYAHSTSFFSLDAHEYEELYIQTLDSRSKKSRVHRAGVFRNFHNFLQKQFDINTVDWFEVEPSINNKYLPSDANIISMREYQAALTLLANDRELDEYNRNINQIILILCYRAALRTGEACFLRIDDIDIFDWIIHVKSCYLHRLKTRTSNRRIPATLFLSDSEKALIKKHIEVVKHYYPDNESAWLFSDKTNNHCAKALQINLDRIREALRLGSGDETLKLKHARHSFANYLMLTMNNSFYPSTINHEIRAWARTDSLQAFSTSVQKLLIGNSLEKEKIMHAIALTMGHISPSTTLQNYIHTLDVFSAAENEKLLSKAITMNEVASLTTISRTNCYKIVDRKYSKNEIQGYQAIKERELKNWKEVQRVGINAVVDIVGLRSLKIKLPQHIIREFNDIERVIRLKENDLTELDITKKLHVDYSFTSDVIDSALNIKKQSGYCGIKLKEQSDCLLFETNSRNYQTHCKFIRQDTFQALISRLAAQTINTKQLEEVSQYWFENHTKAGLLVDKNTVANFLQFIETLDYKTNLVNEYHIRTPYGKRKGVLVKYYPMSSTSRKKTDNRVQHLLFLLKVWVDVTNSRRKEAA